MLSLARDPVQAVPGTNRSKVSMGAYVVRETKDHQVTLASCGSSLHYALGAANELIALGVPTRVVNAPSLDFFELQETDHKKQIFPLDGKPIGSVEEHVATVWARYVTASIGMTTFGHSASNEGNYDRFGLDSRGISGKIQTCLKDLDGSDAQKDCWRQL